MTSALDAIARWAADLQLLAAVLLVGVLAASALVRQPVQRLDIAKAAFVALAALATLCALPGWSAIHLLRSSEPEPMMHARSFHTPAKEPSVARPIPHIDVERIPRESPQLPITVIEAPLTAKVLDRAISPVATIAVIAYLVGSAIMLLWLLVGAATAQRLVRRSAPAPAALHDLLQRIAGADAKAPELLVSKEIATPVAIGIWRPRILLPQSLADDAEPNPQLASIIAHECAHIRHGDLYTLALSRLLLVGLWPQPLFWWLRRLVRLDQETLADAAASDVAGRVSYAEQLMTWARRVSQTPEAAAARLAGAMGLWEGRTQLKRRIAVLLNEQFAVMRRCSRRWRGACMTVTPLVAVALSLVTLQPAGQADDGEPTPHAEVENASGTAGRLPAGPLAAPGSSRFPALPGRVAELMSKLPRTPNVKAGYVVDELGAPVVGAHAALYHCTSDSPLPMAPAQRTKTDDQGFYKFDNVVDVQKEFPEGLPDDVFLESPAKITAVVIQAPAMATHTITELAHRVYKHGLIDAVILKPAVAIEGRVTTSGGRPVAGAEVTAGYYGIPLGVNATTTDADGRFVISDLEAFDADAERRRAEELRKADSSLPAGMYQPSPRVLSIRREGYANKRVSLDKIPITVNTTLTPAGVIEGRIVVQSEDGTARPASDASVTIMRADPPDRPRDSPTETTFVLVEGETTKADDQGRYRFATLLAGRYSLTATAKEGVLAEPLSVSNAAGKTVVAPELMLIPGVPVQVRLINDETGEPLTFDKPTKGYVVRPRVTPDGRQLEMSRESPMTTFSETGVAEIRVAPGTYRFMAHVPDADRRNPRDWWSNYNGRPAVGEPVEVAGAREIVLRMRRGPVPEAEFVPEAEPAERDGDASNGALLQSPALDFKVEAASAANATVIYAPARVQPGVALSFGVDTENVQLGFSPTTQLGKLMPATPLHLESGMRSVSITPQADLPNSRWLLIPSAIHGPDAGNATLRAR